MGTKMQRAQQVPPTAREAQKLQARTPGSKMGKRERQAWMQYRQYNRMQVHQLVEKYPLKAFEVAALLGVRVSVLENWCRYGLTAPSDTGTARFILPRIRTAGRDAETLTTGAVVGAPRPAVRYSPRDVLLFADRVGLEVFDLLCGDYYRDMFEAARVELLAHPAPEGVADPLRVAFVPDRQASGVNMADDYQLRIAQGEIQKTIAAAPRQGVAHRDDGSLISLITEAEFATLLGYTTNWVRQLRRKGAINPDLIVTTDRDRLLGRGRQGAAVFYDGDLIARAIAGDESVRLWVQEDARTPEQKKAKREREAPESNKAASWQ